MTERTMCTKHSTASLPDKDDSQALGLEVALKRATREVFDVIEKATVDTKFFSDDPKVVRVLVGFSTLSDGQVSQEGRVYGRDFEGDCVAKALSEDSLLTFIRSARNPLEGREMLVAGSDASTFEFEIRRADRSLTAEEGSDALALAESEGDALPQALHAAGFELRFFQAQPNFAATLRFIDSRGPELVAALLLQMVETTSETAHYDAFETVRVPTVMEWVERLAETLSSEQNPNYLCLGWEDCTGDRRAEVVEMLRYKVRAMLLAFHAGATPDERWDGVERQDRAFVFTKADGTRIVFEPTSGAFGDYLLETYRIWAKVFDRDGGKPIQRLADGRYVLRLALEISVAP